MRSLVALLACAWVFPANAQVVEIGPFAGEFREGFESQGQTTTAVQCIEPAFGGYASVCAPNAAIGGLFIRREWFLSCLQDAHAGDYQAASNDSWVEVNFTVPIERFGGYFGTHADPGTLSLIFFDRDDEEIGRVEQAFEDLDNSGDMCDWQWAGARTDGPLIWKVRIRHSEHAGALVDLDSLEASTGCGLDDLDCDNSPANLDCDDLDPARYPGAEEICDGIDNDCDDVVPAAESDGDGDGVVGCDDCNDGDASIFPGAQESCDAVDQDCDDIVDEDAVGAAWGSLVEGVCEGSFQVCSSGTWVDPDYSAIDGYEAVEESCDGLDNDCDGVADVGLLGGPVSSGDGVCAELRLECAGEAGFVEPTDWAAQVPYEPTEISCDGLDNDCDGTVDEDLDDPPPASLQFGICQGTVQVCGGDNGWQDPAWEGFDPLDASCDAVDNDCDGFFDEGCVPDEEENTTRNPFEDCGCRSAAGAAPGALWLLLVPLALRTRRQTR